VVGLLLYPITPPVGAFLFSLLSYLIDGCPDIKGTTKQMKKICCPVVRFNYCRLCEAPYAAGIAKSPRMSLEELGISFLA
jgi:hypothetical protein